eukprot:Gb_18766 [translate_table: standard]
MKSTMAVTQDMMLPGGSFPSSCSKLNCPANDSQLRDSAQFKENATKRNAKIDISFLHPPFKWLMNPKDEGTCSDNCKLPETSEQLDSIINGEEQEACYIYVESCGYDSVLPIEKPVSLNSESFKVESLQRTGMAEATSAQAVSRDLVQDSNIY